MIPERILMLKELIIKKSFATVVLCFLCAGAACALEITSFEKEDDGEASVVFCSNLKVLNIGFEQSSYGSAVIMPRELGGYKNIIMPSETLTKNVEQCFLGKCKKVKKCQNEVKLAIVKTKETLGKQLLVDVSFDGELIATFFVTKYMRGQDTVLRVKPPQDLKITDKKYKALVRNFIIAKVTDLM